ncbi:MAG: acyl-CoA dehydrogenase, partial [Chloroflexota bacterium]
IPLLLCGTEAQKAAYLPRFAAETPPRVTSALTERRYQFDPRQLATTSTKDGDQYRLNGSKVYVPLANTADLMLVYAAENGETQGFLVPTDAAGLTIGEKDRLMGIRALPTYEIILEDVTVPASSRVGGENGINFDLLINHSRVALAACAVGMAQAACEYTREYTKQRVQFGKPVAQNQSIAFMLADMFSDVESMRMLVWEAAWMLDQGQEATRTVTVMKQYVDEAILRIGDSAVQALGGYGYIREYPAELYLRNARGFTTFDGIVTV